MPRRALFLRGLLAYQGQGACPLVPTKRPPELTRAASLDYYDAFCFKSDFLIHNVSICSSVFPFVSGTHFQTKMAERTLMTP